MPLILPGNVATALGGEYEVANSCRFNSVDSAYMHKTLGTATNEKKFTFSAWVKRGLLTGNQTIFNVGPDGSDNWETGIRFRAPTDNDIHATFDDRGTATQLITRARYRDVASWIHIVFAIDTTQSTEANRLKLFVNGVQMNDTDTYVNVYPSQNTDCNAMDSGNTIAVGRRTSETTAYFDGYMAEVVFVDGTAYAASDFGEYDEDSPTIWKPKDVSGLTFGNNGFYLDFEASDNLGNDVNGGTDLTEVNLAATDQSTDTCTNNFCTGNNLDNYYAASTFSEGNLKIATNAANKTFNTSTFVLTAGKWYFEVRASDTNSDDAAIGIASVVSPQSGANGGELYDSAGNYAYRSGGNKANNDTSASYGDTWNDDNDIIGVALDLDNLKIYFSKNGTFQDSGDPTSGATGTGAAYTITAPGSQTLTGSLQGYTPAFGEEGAQSDVFELNFGNPTFSLSSGNADGNGYGNFEYAPPSGYLSLCSKNLGSDGG